MRPGALPVACFVVSPSACSTTDPNKGPKTWTELLADAKKLKAAGFTPFGMGNKDGYGGAWFFSLIGKQNLNSIDELKAAMLGKAKFSDPKFSGYLQVLADFQRRVFDAIA